MKVVFALTGRFDTYFKAKRDPLAKAATEAMQAAADGAKDEVRTEVKRAFKRTPPAARRRGQNFEKSFRADAFPNKRRRKFSLSPAAVLKALAGFAGIFETGGKVSPSPGVVIPLPAARRLNLDRSETGRGQLAKKSDIEAAVDRFGEKGGLVSVPVRGGYLLGADRATAMREGLKVKRGFNFAPLFLIQRSVTLPKKLNFIATVRKWQRRLPELFNKVFKDG